MTVRPVEAVPIQWNAALLGELMRCLALLDAPDVCRQRNKIAPRVASGKIKFQPFAVAMPVEMRTYLEAAAKRAGHTLAEEPRIRLQRSIDADQHGELSQELADAVADLADHIEEQIGPSWVNSNQMSDALEVAIATWLELTMPTNVRTSESVDLTKERPKPPDDPATLGRSNRAYFVP
ncbi:MAG TPA: hypothetical protein VGJ20_24870 [Xanthobacteraceae bacterium]|jgi:hypothetical protein